MMNQFAKWKEELGLKDALLIESKDIHTAPWVQLKCQYGCGEYGKRHSCPPFVPHYKASREIFSRYETALLIHDLASWKIRWAVTEIEKRAIEIGYTRAMGLGSGPCKLCEKCDTQNLCVRAQEARPSMEAMGIDVFTTVNQFGYDLKSDYDNPRFFGLVLIK